AQDVLRLVIDVVNPRDTTILHRGRDARIARGEQHDSPRFRPADLGAGGGRTGRDRPLQIEAYVCHDGAVTEDTSGQQGPTEQGEDERASEFPHGFLRVLGVDAPSHLTRGVPSTISFPAAPSPPSSPAPRARRPRGAPLP